jgi:exonuclease SbcC
VVLLTGQLTVISREEWAGYSPKELEAKAVSHIAEHELISNKYKLIEEQIRGLRSKVDTLKGTIESAEKQVDTTIKQREQLSEKIAVKLSQHGGLESVYVEEVIKKEIDLEKTKSEIASYRTQLEAARSQKLKLDADLAGREYPAPEHKAVKEQLTNLQVQTDEINQQMGKLKISLATLEKNLKALETFKKEQDRLCLRANNLNTLKNLFRGAGFVNFASRAYLENIVVAANTRFRKLTRQHLELVLDEDNNFMLRDHMNEGRLRSIKTLSGGQTFQASLSLALALADNVNLQVEADQNFFFLDEGFGSLDKESLGIVFETLKSLRKENRIVGVISHVEEMQQEIDTHLVISMDDAEGSIIRSSLY